MPYLKSLKSARKASVALLTMTLAAGCSKFDDPGPVAVGPELPPLPAELSRECPDPGVATDAVVALAQNRVALAGCRRLHRDTVIFYKGLQADLQFPE